MRHLFISYSSSDVSYRDKLVHYLEKCNLKVWYDQELKRRSTSNWGEFLEDKIRESSGLIVLLSPNAKQSKWVNAEITCAEENGIQIFPVLIENERTNAIPFTLVNNQTYPIYAESNSDLGLLVEAVQSRYIMQPPENLDDYVTVSLAYAEHWKENLIALGEPLYLITAENWRRFDFGLDIQPVHQTFPPDGLIMSIGDLSKLHYGEMFGKFDIYIYEVEGRKKEILDGMERIAFRKPSSNAIPSEIVNWQANYDARVNTEFHNMELIAKRKQEIDALNTEINYRKQRSMTEFGEIIMQVGNWLITEFGLEHLHKSDRFSRHSFHAMDSVKYLSQKRSSDPEDFLRAYYYAMQIFAYLDKKEKTDD